MNEHSVRYQGWRVVAACSASAFFATIPLTSFGIFMPDVCQALAWSREAASTAFGTLTLAAAISAPLAGRLLDRVGARRVIITCLAVSGCASASLLLLTRSLWHFRAIFGLIGLAMTGASPIAYSRAIFGWFDALRGRALGMLMAGSAISVIAIPPIARALIDGFGWRTAWLILGLATLAIALPAAVLFIHDRPRLQADAGSPSEGCSVYDALRSRVLWTLVVVVFCATVATNAALVHIVSLLSDRGVPESQAALALSAMGAASLTGRLATGWMLDRFQPVRVSVVMVAIAAAGPFVLAAAHSLEMGIVAAVCLGFGSGGETDIIPYLLSRYFGLRSLSTLYGLNWTAWGIAGAVGPILMGRAFDATGSYSVTLFVLGVVTLAASGLTSTLPAIPRTQPAGTATAA